LSVHGKKVGRANASRRAAFQDIVARYYRRLGNWRLGNWRICNWRICNWTFSWNSAVAVVIGAPEDALVQSIAEDSPGLALEVIAPVKPEPHSVVAPVIPGAVSGVGKDPFGGTLH